MPRKKSIKEVPQPVSIQLEENGIAALQEYIDIATEALEKLDRMSDCPITLSINVDGSLHLRTKPAGIVIETTITPRKLRRGVGW